jgi:hypothetical protein
MKQKKLSNPVLSCKENEGIAEEYTFMSNEPAPYNEQGIIYYHLANSSPDMSQIEHREMLSRVFAEMNYIMHPLRAIGTSDIKKAYFKIYFVDEKLDCRDEKGELLMKCPYQFKPTTLAVQYAHYGAYKKGKFQKGKWAGYCFVNDRYLFQLNHDTKTEAKSIVNVLTHELVGHGLNLGHTDVLSDIMGPIYNPENTFGPDSCKGINEMYGEEKKKHFLKKDATRFFASLIMGKSVANKPREEPRKGQEVKSIINKIFT